MENLGSEEAQRELLNILVYAAEIAKSIHRLSNTVINCDGSDVEQEWWTALEKLVTIEVAVCITSLLGEVETDGETARLLARLLGVEAKNLPA